MAFDQETCDNFVDIPDDFPGYDISHFCIPGHYLDSVTGVLIPHGLIQERIRKMAKDILKDILDETTVTEDPTANICLDAESLTLTKEQEMITIMDLLSDEKDNFDDLFNISSSGTAMKNTEFNPPFFRTPVIAKTFNFSSSEDQYQSPPPTLPPTINVKSFARQSVKKESIHFLCIIKTQLAHIQMLRRLNCPSIKGGYKFFIDLLDQVNKFNASRSCTSVQVKVDFICLESHKDNLVIEGIENLEVVRGANVVIVEDVVDTGRIMRKLVARLEQFHPKRILIACLLRKRSNVQCYRPHYIGFQVKSQIASRLIRVAVIEKIQIFHIWLIKVPNRMLVGYALDLNEYFRDLLHICILNGYGLQKYKASKN